MTLRLGTVVRAAMGADLTASPDTWAWTDLSTRALARNQVRVIRGRPDESSQTEPTDAQLTLGNSDGALTPRNPNSPWYGQWGIGTPVLISLNTGIALSAIVTDTFAGSGSWEAKTTGDGAHTWHFSAGVTGDYTYGSGVGTISVPVVNTSRRMRVGDATAPVCLDPDLYVDIQTAVLASGSRIEMCLLGRYIDANNYYQACCQLPVGGGAVNLQVYYKLAGTDTLIANAASPVVHAVNTPIRLRFQIIGSTLRLKCWLASNSEPAAWDITVVDTQWTVKGGVGLRTNLNASNTNTLPLATKYDNFSAGEAVATRAQGNVASIAPTWPSGRISYAEVNVTVKGALWRLGQSSVPQSPLFRAITQTSNLVAYWPCEDLDTATQVASGLSGGTPMAVSGTVNFASNSLINGSAPLLTYDPGAQIQSGGFGQTSTNWQLDWHTYVPAVPGSTTTTMQWRFADGEAVLWFFQVNSTDGFFTVFAIDSSGTNLFTMSLGDATFVHAGRWAHWYVTAQQSGGTVNVKATVSASLGSNSFSNTASYTGTIGTQWGYVAAVNNGGGISGLGVGHIVVWDKYDYTEVGNAAFGFWAETASARMSRVCGENGVPIVTVGTSTTRMGAQPRATPLAVLRDAESTDLGIVTDGLGPGLTYLSRESRYNQPVALALDTASQQVKLPFEPFEDDSRTANKVTAVEPSGSSATFTDATSVAALGEYATTASINTYRDSELTDQAAWRVHLGTVAEMRAPTIMLQLIDHPELVLAVLALDIGERYTVANPPSQYPGGLDLILEQYTEMWDAASWTVALTGGPDVPWRVMTLAADSGDTSEFLGRMETDGSTLSSSATTTTTSLSVASTGALWTTASDDRPFDINIDGERITVTNVTGGSSPQTFTVSRSVNGVSKAHLSGAAVSLWQPTVLAL